MGAGRRQPRQAPSDSAVPVQVVDGQILLDPLVARLPWLRRGPWQQSLGASALGTWVLRLADFLVLL
eukprot:5483417-Prorocentrum_lima.AAC.1